MRIDTYNQVVQLYQVNQTKATKELSDKTVSKSDELQISQTGKDMQVANQAVKEATDVREDKVSELQEKLKSGTYNVSGMELAEKLVNNNFNGLI